MFYDVKFGMMMVICDLVHMHHALTMAIIFMSLQSCLDVSDEVDYAAKYLRLRGLMPDL